MSSRPQPSGNETLGQSKPSNDFGTGNLACLSRRCHLRPVPVHELGLEHRAARRQLPRGGGGDEAVDGTPPR